jgi:hypothetical protein
MAAQVVESLPSKCKALNSIPSTTRFVLEETNTNSLPTSLKYRGIPVLINSSRHDSSESQNEWVKKSKLTRGMDCLFLITAAINQ